MILMKAAVRVRGVPDTPKKVGETLQTLLLHNKNNCTLLSEDDRNDGMLVTAKDYIAYGDVETETVTELLRKRGRVEGNPLEDEVASLGYDSIADLVDALAEGETTLYELRSQGLQVPFRLSPPSKGYSDTKRHYNQGGSLGQRDDMDALLRRMI